MPIVYRIVSYRILPHLNYLLLSILLLIHKVVGDVGDGIAAALAGWPVTVDAERYRCACWLAGRGDGYQYGLDWGLSSQL